MVIEHVVCLAFDIFSTSYCEYKRDLCLQIAFYLHCTQNPNFMKEQYSIFHLLVSCIGAALEEWKSTLVAFVWAFQFWFSEFVFHPLETGCCFQSSTSTHKQQHVVLWCWSTAVFWLSCMQRVRAYIICLHCIVCSASHLNMIWKTADGIGPWSGNEDSYVAQRTSVAESVIKASSPAHIRLALKNTNKNTTWK